MRRLIWVFVFIISLLPLSSWSSTSYSTLSSTIFQPKCIACHTTNGSAYPDFTSCANVLATLGVVAPGNPSASALYNYVIGNPPMMPPGGPYLSSTDTGNISSWITAGASCSSSTETGTITITKPAAIGTYSSPVTITASGTANVPINQMQVWIDHVKQGSYTGSSFTTTASGLASGSHLLEVIEDDNSYNEIDTALTGTLTFTVSSSSSETGTITITKPAAIGTYSSPVTITASGTANVPINQMQVWIDHVKQGSYTGSSFTTTASGLASGSHLLEVIEDDNSYNKIDTALTGTLTFTVSSSGITVSPKAVVLTTTQTQQFTASLSSTWSVDGVSGGNSTVGTITSGGLYTPPKTTGTHTVTATNQTNKSQTGTSSVWISGLTGVLTQHYDVGRTGQNTSEIALSSSNVNSTQFGKLFSYALDGMTFAQPLYLANVNVPGVGNRNLVFVATMHDSIYAFDADNRQATYYWKTSFITPPSVVPIPRPTSDSTGFEQGVLSTPVIDPATNTLYALAGTSENGTIFYRLHALDVTTGKEKMGGPVAVQATVPGTGEESDGKGNLPFVPVQHLQRTGLLLANGNVYFGFASYADQQPYHGWLFAYSASNVQTRVGVFCSTPNGEGGGIWQSGGGIAADAFGNIYTTSGNGTNTAYTNTGIDFGSSAVKLSTNLSSVYDWFMPYNQQTLDLTDLDFGSTPPVMLPYPQPGPNPYLVVALTKASNLYVMNKDNMGKYHAGSNSQIVQEMDKVSGMVRSSPAFWNGYFFVGGEYDHLRSFKMGSNGQFSSPAVGTGVSTITLGFEGASPVITANGTSNGIAWTQEYNQWNPSVVRAFNANNLSQELWDSTMNATRDALDSGVVFQVPIVANGKVFVGTKGNLTVYGLLP